MNQPAAALTPIRRHDIDWLRIFAVYFFLIFQTVWILDAGSPFDVNDDGLPVRLNTVGFFISQWYIPLIFLISGWSRKNSMQQRTGMGSLKERMFRLVIPFATGCILIWPLIAYVQMINQPYIGSRGGRMGTLHARSFLDFLAACFTQPYTYAWSHLWLMPSLFAFTLLSWPFFSWVLKRKVTPLKISRMWAYFPIIPLTLLQAGKGTYRPGMESLYESWTGAAYFFVYFIIGFIISRYGAYERVIHQEAWHAGIIGFSLFLLLKALPPSLPSLAFVFISSVASWCFVVAVLGFAKKYLENTTSWFSYLRESALPVYVFHQVPILIFGLFIVRLDIGTFLQYMILLITSAGGTMVFYHFLIRRFPVLQVLFGMKLERKPVEGWKDQVLNRDRG